MTVLLKRVGNAWKAYIQELPGDDTEGDGASKEEAVASLFYNILTSPISKVHLLRLESLFINEI